MLRLRRLGWSLGATAAAAVLLVTPQAQATHLPGFGHDNVVPAGYGTSATCDVSYDGCLLVADSNNSYLGVGVIGRHTSFNGGGGPAPYSAGVFGETNSQGVSAVGVYGRVANGGQPGSGSAGVRGDTNSIYGDAAGVIGWNYGTGPGIRAYSEAGTGISASSNGGGYGVSASSQSGTGIYGSTSGTSSGIAGVRGTSYASNTYGVYGDGGGQSGGLGIYGTGSRGVLGVHVGSVATDPGVEGDTGSTGSGAVGVLGKVTSTSPGGSSAAVRGINNGTGGAGIGVWGSQAGSGYGVYGTSAAGKGVVGTSTTGMAGFFIGNVQVTGTLTKGAGAFKIDHPLDPAHKYLQHSFVESPDMMDVYDGNVTTDGKGFAVVRLPAYFQALNRDFRYQLTVIDRAHWTARAAVWSKIAHNRFTIRTTGSHVQVSWQVTGVRHDPYANAHRIQVVVPKTGAENGKYLHPELYGQPQSKSLARAPGISGKSGARKAHVIVMR